MKKVVILWATLALTTSSFAEDHLEPDSTSILGGTTALPDYNLLVRDKLKDAYANSVEVRMVALPSFAPEYAVGLVSLKKMGRGAPYHIFALTPAAQLWTYATIDMFKRGEERVMDKDGKDSSQREIAKLESSVPKIEELKISRCETEINDDLSTRIVEVWRKMLVRTRYSDQNPMGLDGATYHFSIVSPKSGMLAGEVWSPARDSAAGNLVELADTMRNVCNRKNGANVMALEKITAELEHRLQ